MKDSEAVRVSVVSEGAVKAVSALDVESQDEAKLVDMVREAEGRKGECSRAKM